MALLYALSDFSCEITEFCSGHRSPFDSAGRIFSCQSNRGKSRFGIIAMFLSKSRFGIIAKFLSKRCGLSL